MAERSRHALTNNPKGASLRPSWLTTLSKARRRNRSDAGVGFNERLPGPAVGGKRLQREALDQLGSRRTIFASGLSPSMVSKAV